uniref:Putative secreted protein n=1 Tax=Amblyomma triste TaxID=251400 RepID=A0A023G387_AMBTT
MAKVAAFTSIFLFRVLMLFLCISLALVQFFRKPKSAKVVFSSSLKCSTLIAPSFSNSRYVFFRSFKHVLAS